MIEMPSKGVEENNGSSQETLDLFLESLLGVKTGKVPEHEDGLTPGPVKVDERGQEGGSSEGYDITKLGCTQILA